MRDRPAVQFMHEPGDGSGTPSRARNTRNGLLLADPLCRRAQQAQALQRALLKTGVTLVAVLAAVVVVLASAQLTLRRFESSYDGRIYPRVYALNVNLSGLTPEQARAALAEPARHAEPGPVTLRHGEQRWCFQGRALGVHYDVDGTVEAAMATGRSAGNWAARLAAWLRREDLSPLWAIDAAPASAVLTELAAQVAASPVEAALELHGERLAAVPGEPGHALDVEASVRALASAVRTRGGNVEVALALRPLPPDVADARPALPQAEAMLEHPPTLMAYDVLADETLSWALDRATVASWLRVRPTAGADELRVEAAPEAVRATLAGLNDELGQGRGLLLDEATRKVCEALAAGEATVSLRLSYPERSHTVQAGEVLEGIAADYGLPPVLIAEANPGLQPNWLRVGQQLTIPSLDLLLPHMPVPSKRIVVNLGEQRLNAYQEGTLRWSWPCSTGAAGSPTLRGTFQVLEKVPEGSAARWGLQLPHFLAVYPTGEGEYCGIHALPISPTGARVWSDTLGHPVSTGSIVLGIEEAALLYEWAEPGVPVVIE
jgi:LysM repeat protein